MNGSVGNKIDTSYKVLNWCSIYGHIKKQIISGSETLKYNVKQKYEFKQAKDNPSPAKGELPMQQRNRSLHYIVVSIIKDNHQKKDTDTYSMNASLMPDIFGIVTDNNIISKTCGYIRSYNCGDGTVVITKCYGIYKTATIL